MCPPTADSWPQALLALPVADETLAQIEKDLPRTLSQQHSSLLTPGSALWVSLRNLLIAFAAFDAATGYVQSMNFVAAFLLQQGLQEEAAFWSLVALVTRVVPYFGEGMPLAKCAP